MSAYWKTQRVVANTVIPAPQHAPQPPIEPGTLGTVTANSPSFIAIVSVRFDGRSVGFQVPKSTVDPVEEGAGG